MRWGLAKIEPEGERELRIELPLALVVQRLRAQIDALHAWQGGGITFGRKPFLGEGRGSSFSIRASSSRRDGATVFLVGKLHGCDRGTLIRYRLETPDAYLRSLPFFGVVPVVLFAVGGYFGSRLVAFEGTASSVFMAGVGAIVGLCASIFLISFARLGVRRDHRRLQRFARFSFLIEP